jgi:hypothetical protein
MTKIKTTGIPSIFILFLFFIQTYSQVPSLQRAWEYFNNEKYVEAIKFCDKCIDDFSQDARSKQREMERSNMPAPPVGKVSDAEKNAIFARGSLNDVATAYWMKGRASEYLYNQNKLGKYKRMAETAYNEACVLKYGRTWDSQGWFWSPCEAAKKRLPVK